MPLWLRSIKIDLTVDESVVRSTQRRPIAHAYPDELPGDAAVRCYTLEEVFAEKIRAMAQRSRPRDLYDIINLYHRYDLGLDAAAVHAILEDKCEAKGMAVPTSASTEDLPYRAELESEWGNMLGHQLPALPPIESFLTELDAMFAWLEGGAQPSVPAALATASDEDETWNPPPTIATWGARAPLEIVRFAATNRLCVELGYKGSVRVIEPYSLRQTRAGNLVLHALRADDRQHRSYRVDQIESVRATSRSFTPAYAVEFAASGPLSAPPARGGRRSPVARARHTSRQPSGPECVVECTRCGRRFRRKTRNTRMRRHKDPSGLPCAGTRGRLVG